MSTDHTPAPTVAETLPPMTPEIEAACRALLFSEGLYNDAKLWADHWQWYMDGRGKGGTCDYSNQGRAERTVRAILPALRAFAKPDSRVLTDADLLAFADSLPAILPPGAVDCGGCAPPLPPPLPPPAHPAQQPAAPGVAEALREAAAAVVDGQRFSYLDRHGRVCSVEPHDGKPVMLVRCDLIDQLSAALSAPAEGEDRS